MKGGDTTLFLSTWKLNRNIAPSQLAKASAKMLESGGFPTEGSEIIQWLVCPGGHGITIIKADSEATAMRI